MHQPPPGSRISSDEMKRISVQPYKASGGLQRQRQPHCNPLNVHRQRAAHREGVGGQNVIQPPPRVVALHTNTHKNPIKCCVTNTCTAAARPQADGTTHTPISAWRRRRRRPEKLLVGVAQSGQSANEQRVNKYCHGTGLRRPVASCTIIKINNS